MEADNSKPENLNERVVLHNADMNETLHYFGGELKSTGDGKFAGYLVRFSSADSPDLSGQFFTKETDFGFTDTLKSPVYFNHRLPLKTKDGNFVEVKSVIGEAVLSMDDEGVLIDAIVYNRKKYEQVINKAGKAKHLGWSSGTAKHLVDIDEDGNIKKWPLGLDASLTPIPCEPQNRAIEARSLSAVKFQPLEEIFIETDESEELDIKSLFDETKDAPAASPFLDHLESVLAAVQEVQTRAKSIHELRVKVGRQLSKSNRERLSLLLQGMLSCAGDIDTLLKETEPVEKSIDSDLVRGLVAGFELLKLRQRKETLCLTR